MKIIALGGSPGTGKSTLMKAIMARLGFEESSVELYPLVPGHKSKTGNMVVLGKYDADVGVFGGTDKMSMAVMPKAIEYIAGNPADVILFEGDRLFSHKFLQECVSKAETRILVLTTTSETRTKRYADRGSNQNETWLAGRETKIANITSDFSLMAYMDFYNHETPEETSAIVDNVVRFING